MIPFAGDVATLRGEYLLALAQGLSGLLGITAAILIFVVERLVRRYRVHDRAYNAHLIVLSIVSGFTILLSALTWWAWASAAPHIDLLFGWPVDVWMAILFGTITLAASASLLFGLILLIRAYLNGRSDDWAP